MGDRRLWIVWIIAIFGGATFGVGCATGGEESQSGAPTHNDCVSGEGQRFLTYCASPEAARLARQQHTIGRAADEEVGAQDMVPLPVETAPIFGSPGAALTIHLFSDFRCSGCRETFELLLEEVEKNPDDVRLVFRHTPTDDAGEVLARGAIAAAEQGRFWEFARELYEQADVLDDLAELPAVAASSGLDVETWQRDRERERIGATLARDGRLADEVDVVGVPTFFINGLRMVGAVPADEVEEFVRQERAEIESMAAAGLEGAEISWRRILQNYRPVNWEAVEEREEELEQSLRVAYVPVGDAPRMGASREDSSVTVVVFADFECPYCEESAQVWRDLVALYESAGLRVVFKHFPIQEGAERVAAASVLAHGIGEFWSFHDAAFEGALEDDGIQQLLENLGWSGDLEEELAGAKAVVQADREFGRGVGVDGTPTIFINGIHLMGVWSVEELAPLIEDQMELGETLRELTGNGGEELYRDLVEINGD